MDFQCAFKGTNPAQAIVGRLPAAMAHPRHRTTAPWAKDAPLRTPPGIGITRPQAGHLGQRRAQYAVIFDGKIDFLCRGIPRQVLLT